MVHNRQLSRPFVLLKVVQGMLSFYHCQRRLLFGFSSHAFCYVRTHAMLWFFPSFSLTGKIWDQDIFIF